MYDNSGILNFKGIIQEISRDSLQDKCTMYNRSLMRQNVLDTCVKIFSYLFHFNGNIRLSSQSNVAAIGRSGFCHCVWVLTMIAGLSLSCFSLGCHYKHRDTEAMIADLWSGSIYTSFWFLSNELRVTRSHFSVIYAITSPYFRKSMKWVLILIFPCHCFLFL